MVLPVVLFGQGKCSCPEPYNYEKKGADKVYQYENGKTIGLCGYSERENSHVVYSEFVLFDCVSNKVLGEWGATQTCFVDFDNDTLVVKELKMLPVGKKFAYSHVPLIITKIYHRNKGFSKVSSFNKHIPKYSPAQVNKVLEKYKDLNMLQKRGYYDSIIVISDMLLWSYVSGSKIAEKYLNKVEKSVGPFDGAIAEEWNEIWMLYLYYKEKSGQAKIK